MDDFLHNLRTGKDKRYDRTRKTYDQSQYRPMDRQNGMDRRKKAGFKQPSAEQAYQTISKVLPVMKTLLESIAEDSRQLTVLEERKTAVLEQIASALKKMTAQNEMEPQDVSAPAALKAEAVLSEMSGESADPLMAAGDAVDIMRRLREEGLTFERIAQYLDENGIPTPSGRGKWRGQAVSKLLKE